MNHLNVDIQTRVALKLDERDRRIAYLEYAMQQIRAFNHPRPCDDWLDSARDSYHIANDVLGSQSDAEAAHDK